MIRYLVWDGCLNCFPRLKAYSRENTMAKIEWAMQWGEGVQAGAELNDDDERAQICKGYFRDASRRGAYVSIWVISIHQHIIYSL